MAISVVAGACRIALSLAGLSLVLQAQPSRPAVGNRLGSIDGVVSDSNAVALAGATVSLFGSAVHVETGPNGRFRIVELPAAPYIVIVRRLGYRSLSSVVDVQRGDTVRLGFVLERAPTVLDTVQVTARYLSPRLQEFENRRKLGEGQFLNADEIYRRSAVTAGDLIRTFRGVSLQEFPGGGGTYQYFLVSLRGGLVMPTPPQPGMNGLMNGGGQAAKCFINIFVDDVAMPPPLDVDKLPPPPQIAAIEFYSGPATVPMVYRGFDSSCGAILIWTKDGSSPVAGVTR